MHAYDNQKDEGVRTWPETLMPAEGRSSQGGDRIPETVCAAPNGRRANAPVKRVDESPQAEKPAYPPALRRTEAINLALREHQENSDRWALQVVVGDLHCWAERMTVEFKLEIGIPCLLIEHLSRRYGHYRCGRNGFGLRDEIGLDRSHVEHSPYWRVLGTVLHELLHSWQAYHGESGCRNYHNREFRDKARSLGLVVDAHGHTQYAPGDTPFFRLLKRFGIEVPSGGDSSAGGLALIPASDLPPIFGSKLKLYECPCHVKVRVGRSRFNAKCLDCGGRFVPKEAAGPSSVPAAP